MVSNLTVNVVERDHAGWVIFDGNPPEEATMDSNLYCYQAFYGFTLRHNQQVNSFFTLSFTEAYSGSGSEMSQEVRII